MDPIFSTATQETLAKYKSLKEKLLVAAITPYLLPLVTAVDPQYLLVNSEEIPWIPSVYGTLDNRDRPDLFMIPKCAFIPHPRPTTKNNVVSEQAAAIRNLNDLHKNYFFGSCATALRDSVHCLFEAKPKISFESDLGETFPKLQNLYHSTHIVDYYCVLFDTDQLYLLNFTLTGLRSYYQLKWTTPKSRSFLLKFLSPEPRYPPWYTCLIKSCEKFKVHLAPPAFLGSGATGKVFYVESDEKQGEIWALKVVDKILYLRSEFEIIEKIRSKSFPQYILDSLPLLSPVCQSPFCVGDLENPSAGSMLLGPVGQSIEKENRSDDLFYTLLRSLFLLHRFRIRHGDPRMPNIIRVSSNTSSSSISSSGLSSRLVWIDLRETYSEYSRYDYFALDFRIFIKSFFHLPADSKYDDLEKEYFSLWEQVKLATDQLTASTAPPISQGFINTFEVFARKIFDNFKLVKN